MIKEFIEDLIKDCTNVKELEDKISKMEHTLIAKEFDKEIVMLRVEQRGENYNIFNIYIDFETRNYGYYQIFCSKWFKEPDKIKSFEVEGDHFLVTSEKGRKLIVVQNMGERNPYRIKLENGVGGTGSWTAKEIGF